ncbi:uncharacterized protein UV8b_00722 [Ustilaginoidea virens]|uniref:Uncharacterized protein n=1 Tax=Ustilaginoidea virens TaxID=1159556 RepID=A0A8E5HJA2_USTVR|nr:uncharacterized protein UV8b_00722 [Ustilaginoidea virens]QUC16481.1 hypothetical protein UV8b_00722 [Ustilaginoidea virens]
MVLSNAADRKTLPLEFHPGTLEDTPASGPTCLPGQKPCLAIFSSLFISFAFWQDHPPSLAALTTIQGSHHGSYSAMTAVWPFDAVGLYGVKSKAPASTWAPRRDCYAGWRWGSVTPL